MPEEKFKQRDNKNEFDWKKIRVWYCPNCKQNKFIVGHINYMTIIKCIKCKHEQTVHEG
uniref:Uncharacterized protein n=1 Tax=viral metagenome TaxID=1070528 RepID=A0A6M3JFW9_9ZZZZ